MVSVEVRNSTHEPAAYNTTTSAPLAREESSAGFLNTKNYREKKSIFRSKKAKEQAQREYEDSWRAIIQTEGTYDDAEVDTGEIDAIQELADKVNSGELYATEEIVEELGERALALVDLVDVKYPAAPVENAILRVVAVNPNFKDEADAAVGRIYDNRPDMTPVMKKVIHDTVSRTAEVASNPDNFIDLDNIDEAVPRVNRILEEASNLVTSRRINQVVQEKEWAEEDAQENNRLSA